MLKSNSVKKKMFEKTLKIGPNFFIFCLDASILFI